LPPHAGRGVAELASPPCRRGAAPARALVAAEPARVEARPGQAAEPLARGEARAAGQRRFRLLSYNVHRCIGLDLRHDLTRVARVIAAQEPDIVALQELDVSRPRTGLADQPRWIAEILSMEFLFHPIVRFAVEQSGTAVMSRWPMRLVRSELLPTLGHRRLEQRGALWVAVEVAGVELQVINTHLGLVRSERRLQVAALLGPNWLAHPECSEPWVLCGDLNMSRRGAALCFAGVCERADREPDALRPPRTWPSPLPLVALDHVFCSPGLALESVQAVRGLRARVASDHLPILATFRV
jgi:endonuclease/exonuclease/phosphatase family metal-dependent hydrolase